jgi:hypothetical protein
MDTWHKGIQSILAILIACNLMGCMAMTNGTLPVAESISGMKAAVTGAPGTWVYSKEGSDFVVLGWSQGSRYAFVMVDKAAAVLKDLRNVCALDCNWMSAADLLIWLEKNGWQSVPAGTLSAGLASQISNVAFLLSIGSRSLPTLLLVPMGVVPANPLDLVNPQVAQ